MAYTHILAPTDLSDPSNHALRHAFEEAEIHQATLTLLHVLPRHAASKVYYVKGGSQAREEFGHALVGFPTGFDLETGGTLPVPAAPAPELVHHHPDEEALERLRDLVPDTFKGTWEAKVATGKAADAILHAAQEDGVDLIVMGTHGHTGLCHTILGSVAEAVMRHSRCPVLMVRYGT